MGNLIHNSYHSVYNKKQNIKLSRKTKVSFRFFEENFHSHRIWWLCFWMFVVIMAKVKVSQIKSTLWLSLFSRKKHNLLQKRFIWKFFSPWINCVLDWTFVYRWAILAMLFYPVYNTFIESNNLWVNLIISTSLNRFFVTTGTFVNSGFVNPIFVCKKTIKL